MGSGGHGRLWNASAWLVLLAVFAWNVYRACTLAITHDEALTYRWYVRGGPPAILSPRCYDANNHVLHSLLAWGGVRLFGPSELSLRLVSLLGGLLYLVMARRLCLLLCGPTLLSLLGFLLLALNPFVLDYLAAARGYSLGLGLSLAAWYHLCRYRLACLEQGQAGPPRPWLNRAGAEMGLAVAANLVYAVPNAALALAFLSLSLWERRHDLWAEARRLGRSFVAPGLAAVCPLAVVLCGARGDKFYFGADSLNALADSLLRPSFFPVPDRGGLGLAWATPARTLPVLKVLLLVLAAVTLAVLARVLRRAARQGRPPADPWANLCVLLGGGAALTCGLLVLNHHALGVKYPQGRTGLYLVPLAAFCLLLVLEGLRRKRAAARWTTAPVAAALALGAAHFLTQQHGGYLYEWWYDAGSRRVFDRLVQCSAGRERPVAVGSCPLFEPSLTFYQDLRRLGSLTRFGRAADQGRHELYLLQSPKDARIRQERLQVLYEDPVSHAVLAAPRSG
jgi:hypothetical protein